MSADPWGQLEADFTKQFGTITKPKAPEPLTESPIDTSSSSTPDPSPALGRR